MGLVLVESGPAQVSTHLCIKTLMGMCLVKMDVLGRECCLLLLKGLEWEAGGLVFVAAKVASRWFPLEALE